MNYGIDQLIEDKKDAYRGNPAALQQRSKVSKELTDLLALEQLTKEVDARSRNFQLQAQQQPETIAKQLEQKAMGQQKDKIVKGVAGVMKTNQAKQQANMQRMASAGIAGQPRPNMQMMAQGGVVGYAKGKDVSAIRAKLLAEVNAQNISDDEKAKLVAAVNEIPTAQLAQSSSVTMPTLRAFGIGGKRTSSAPAPIQDDPALAKKSGTAFFPMQGPTYVPDAMGGTGDDMMRGLGGPAIEPPADEPPVEKTSPELDTGLGSVGTNVGAVKTAPGMTVTAPTARTKDQLLTGTYSTRDDYKDLTSTKEGIAGAKKLIDSDPEAMRDDAMKFGLDKLGITDARRDAEARRQQAVRDLNKRQTAGNTNDQLLAYLQGVAQSGSLGGGLASLRNTRSAQQKDELARLTNEQSAERAFEGKEQEIKVKAFDFAKDSFKIAQENIRSGASTMATFNSTEQRGLSEDAKNLLNKDATNLSEQAKDRKLQLDTAVANASNLTKIALGNASNETKRAVANAASKVKISIANLEASLTREKNALEERLKNKELFLKDKQAGATLLEKTESYIAKVTSAYEKIYLEMEETLKYSGLEEDKLTTALKELNARKAASLEIAVGQMRLDTQAIRRNLANAGGVASTTTPSRFGKAKAKPTGP